MYRFNGFVLFFKQKTAYEMRISDWSSDVCSSDLQKNAACHCVEDVLRYLCGDHARQVGIEPGNEARRDDAASKQAVGRKWRRQSPGIVIAAAVQCGGEPFLADGVGRRGFAGPAWQRLH